MAVSRLNRPEGSRCKVLGANKEFKNSVNDGSGVFWLLMIDIEIVGFEKNVLW